MKSLNLFAILITAVTLSQTTWAIPELMVARHGRSEPRLHTDDVIGHTYMTRSEGVIQTNFRCGEIIADLNHALVDADLFNSSFVYDYAMACVPAGDHQNYVLVDLTVEPATMAAVDLLDQYRNQRQGQIIHKQLINFRLIQKITVEKSFTADFLDPQTDDKKYTFTIASSQWGAFANFAQYQNHLHKETNLFFRNPDPQAVLDYLSYYLSPGELEIFKARGMRKGNYMSTQNERKMTFDDGDVQPGLYADGALRDCRQFNEAFCLVDP